MLKGIPPILTPELLKVLMEMGHGDEIVLADGNFPRFAYPEAVVRCDGHGVPELLDAILQFMPLDTYQEIGFRYEKDGLRENTVDKYAFYERARKAYAVVTTGEKALYANVILRKGVV